MFTCPLCAKALQSQQGAQGVLWICPTCQGRAVALSVLRKVFGNERVMAIWMQVLDETTEEGCACPVCLKNMNRVTWTDTTTTLTLDLCRRCEFVWFDPKKYEGILPAIPTSPALGQLEEKHLPLAAREALALEKVKALAKQEIDWGGGPNDGWKTLPALFGFPVEIDSTVANPRKPVATYLSAAIISVVSLWAFLNDNDMANRLGLIPAAYLRYDGLTFFTSFFLHANLVHLIGNLYFLIIFGRHVEEYLGAWRWLLVVAVAALGGDFIDVGCTAGSTVPLIGASGGISGLLAFYAFKFPHARLGILFRYVLFFRWITIPAWGAFACWLLLQFWGAYDQLYQAGTVASLAHLGGVGAGVIFWQLWKNLDAKPRG